MCGDVGNSWACQIGLGASVQRDFLGLVAWWVEGDCARVFQALAAWPRICFCRVTCSPWMLAAGEREILASCVIRVCVTCGSRSG